MGYYFWHKKDNVSLVGVGRQFFELLVYVVDSSWPAEQCIAALTSSVIIAVLASATAIMRVCSVRL